MLFLSGGKVYIPKYLYEQISPAQEQPPLLPYLKQNSLKTLLLSGQLVHPRRDTPSR
jgi:hypothetical protein